jgi:hypothetical protein
MNIAWWYRFSAPTGVAASQACDLLGEGDHRAGQSLAEELPDGQADQDHLTAGGGIGAAAAYTGLFTRRNTAPHPVQRAAGPAPPDLFQVRQETSATSRWHWVYPARRAPHGAVPGPVSMRYLHVQTSAAIGNFILLIPAEA